MSGWVCEFGACKYSTCGLCTEEELVENIEGQIFRDGTAGLETGVLLHAIAFHRAEMAVGEYNLCCEPLCKHALTHTVHSRAHAVSTRRRHTHTRAHTPRGDKVTSYSAALLSHSGGAVRAKVREG